MFFCENILKLFGAAKRPLYIKKIVRNDHSIFLSECGMIEKENVKKLDFYKNT